MKTLTVHVPKEQLSRLIDEARPGDVIILTDGERRVNLEASSAKSRPMDMDLEEDSHELEAELLKAINGPFTPYSSNEMRSIVERIIQEEQQK